jgi:hypothetical protein
MNPFKYISPDTRREYLVYHHLHFGKHGYEHCTYDVFLETRKVAECQLTSEIPFTVTRFETSN